MNKIIVKIRPITTGLRIDEYYFWIKDILKWQKSDFDINIILIDLPILLQSKQKDSLNVCVKIVKDLFKLGLDFTRVNVVFQSQLPELQEMMSYLQYSNKLTNNSLNYHEPTLEAFLEAAIAMIFFADIVLINKWEVKKIEQMRDLINKFNFNFGKILKLPESFVSFRPKLIGLDGKENLSDNNCLLFSDNENIVKKKIITATTDSDSVIKFDIKKKPQISNLINLYQFLTDKTYDEIEDEFRGKKYVEFKDGITKQLNKFLKSNVKKSVIESDDVISKLLLESNRKSRHELRKKLRDIKEVMGFAYLKI